MTILSTSVIDAAARADCFHVSRAGLPSRCWAWLKGRLSGIAYVNGVRTAPSRIATDLDDRILKDIGAPPWLMAQAQQCREAQVKYVHDMLRF